jgi:phospholipase C
MIRRLVLPTIFLLSAAVAIVIGAAAGANPTSDAAHLSQIDHIVVIYQENHSFDNLFGGWEGVNGLANEDAAHTTQVSQTEAQFHCLLQDDVNLTSPPLASTCNDTTTGTAAGTPFHSAFANAPFRIDDHFQPSDVTCAKPTVFAPADGYVKGDPNALPGGCTRDLVHRYYQEQYQIDGGKQDRYVTGSDAGGLSMGYFDTKQLPLYAYLHDSGHPDYAISDNFFQAAFGGSFLNHQWLIAAATPVWANALNDGSSNDRHSVLDANGMPVTMNGTTPGLNYPLYVSATPAATLLDRQETQSCSPPANRGPKQPGFVCGDYAVNTTQPWYQPYSPGTADAQRLPPLNTPNIGDELTAAGVSWAWYAGGWDNASGNTAGLGWSNGAGPNCSDPNVNTNVNVHYPFCPDGLFQFHHQPFNYFANYAPGTPGRTHLQDEKNFQQLASDSDSKTCNLKQVSFIKPIGEDNEHPGYGSETHGNTHLVSLLQSIEGSACAKDTMIIVTYDEFGGQWDHVSPPGQGNNNGPHDQWGPGTRIPALVVAPHLRGGFVVDSTEHDTTSIIATIEDRYGLDPLGSRDAAVPDMASVFSAKQP